ncbi:hypothetical protein [Polyangium sorediatum]|uniref:Lipoprotein n=1 Tax=Polyangium sorediatum TaxID=889274 RepID=A0ABT6P343_9BACT|nr:hypothetical protein [Polyangium sorediatum]MDI1434777.1 hypothetical protein [Polyangium sorediatum]
MQKVLSVLAGCGLAMLAGCILVYDAGEYEDAIGDTGGGGRGGAGGAGGSGGEGGVAPCLVEWCHTGEAETTCSEVTCPTFSSRRIPLANNQDTRAIGVGSAAGGEQIFVAGQYTGNMTLGDTTIPGELGKGDAFVAAFGPAPSFMATRGLAIGSALGGSPAIGYTPRIAHAVAFGAANTVIVGGRYREDDPFMMVEENHNAFLRSVTPDLKSISWTATFGGGGVDEVVAVAASPQWAYALASIAPSPGDNPSEVVLPCGSSQLIQPKQHHMALFQYDSSGACQWVVRPTGGLHTPTALVASSNNDIYVAGTYSGKFEGLGKVVPEITEGTAMFVMKVGVDGKVAWVNTYHALMSNATPTALAVSGSDLFVTGSVRGSLDFGDKVRIADQESPFLLVLDSAGAKPRSVVMPGAFAEGVGLAATSAGEVIMTGTFFPTLDFDPHREGVEMDEQNLMSAFLAKFDAQAKLQTFDLIGTQEAPTQRWLPLASNGARVYLAGGWSTHLRFEDTSVMPLELDVLLAHVQP